MQECLILASIGGKNVGNGAKVGAVLVRKNKIIAQGFHPGFGQVHAERALLESFHGEVRGEDVLYVNLEPCCHQGKTKPCTDIILEKGVKQVVYGMKDPDPRVSGQGAALLRQCGVEVFGPVQRAACEYINRGFASVRTKGRPWITLKKAQTVDGAVANDDGSPLKITSAEQDRWAHTFLRARHDGILVGVETVVRDNPRLDKRLDQKRQRQEEKIQPWRIVLDPHLRIPLITHVVTDGMRSDTIILASRERSESRQAKDLRGKGVRVFPVATDDAGHFVMTALWDALLASREGFHGLTSILVEGGARTWQFFRESGVMDEEVTLVGGAKIP